MVYCVACEVEDEEVVCSVCGMNGKEIALAREADKQANPE